MCGLRVEGVARGRNWMSAVPQDAVAVPQDDFAVGEVLEISGEPARRRRGWLMRRLLVFADVVGLVAAYLAAIVAIAPNTGSDTVHSQWEIALFLACLPLWVVLFRVHGLYDRDEEHTDHSTVDDVVGVFQAVTLGTWSFLVLTSIFELPHPSLPRLVFFWIAAVLLVPLLRAVARILGRRHAAYIQNVIVVGSGQVARLLDEKVMKHPEYGLRILGFVDRQNDSFVDQGAVPTIGTPADLPELVRSRSVQRVVIAFSTDTHVETLDIIRSLQDADVQIDIVPRMFEVLGAGAQMHTIEGIPLVGLAAPKLSGSSRFLKRSLDVAGATVGLVLLSPILAATALWIKLDSSGPVFFRQVRMGHGGETFRVFKFRTMVRDAEDRKAELATMNMHATGDPRMFKVPNDPRVTRAGALLRRWRIDELPQLLNVLKGDMSLVGPRPLILDEDQFVERWARRRLDLKPGMTGLWQVLGASDIPFDEMTKLDYLYVTNWSLREDLRLIFLTVPALARTRAAY